MTHRSTTARDRGVAEVALGSRIESHEAVRLHARLHEPDPVIRVDGHAVGSCPLAAGVGPFPHLAGRRIQSAEVSPGVIHEPDLAVGSDERVARAALFPGHLLLVDLDLLLMLGNRRGGRREDRGQGRDNDDRDALQGASLELSAVFDC